MFLPAWLCSACMQCLGKPDESMRVAESLGATVTDRCEPPHGCWEQKLGLLQELFLKPQKALFFFLRLSKGAGCDGVHL